MSMKDEILQAAIQVAERDGWSNMTRDAIANHAGVAMGSVNAYYGTLKQLRRAVMRAAVRQQHHRIIAQGLALGDKDALKAPRWVREAAVSKIVG